MYVTIIGDTRADTRSVDYGSCEDGRSSADEELAGSRVEEFLLPLRIQGPK